MLTRPAALLRTLNRELRIRRRLLSMKVTIAVRAFRGPLLAGAEEPEPDSKTFTQADVDRIVQERLARDRSTRAADAPTAEEVDELRKRAARADELEAASQTEVERAVAAKEAAERERDEAQQQAQQAQERANETLRKAAVVAAAAKAGATDPDDVYALIKERGFAVEKDGNKLEVTIGDDGQVTGTEDAISAFLDAKPHLVGETTPRPGPGDGGARSTPPADDFSQLDDPDKVIEAAGQL